MRRSHGFGGIVLLGSVAATLLQVQPLSALEVSVQPTRAALGDTLSILIQSEANAPTSLPPTVKLNQRSFPAFPLGPNRWRALVPTTPLESPGRRSLTVSHQDAMRNLLVWVGDRRFPVQRIWLPPGKASQGTDQEFDRVDAFKALVTPQKGWSGPFLRPNSGPLTTGYGVRRYYNGVFAQDYYHRGLDYAGGIGSPVFAAAAGRVALVGRESQGFLIHGNVVGLDHGQGVTTIYLHLSRIQVQEGDSVKPGQVIGTVGATGAVTGPHLHWGLYVQGQSVDPRPWLTSGFE